MDFDVFLSYNDADGPTVEELARKLFEEKGLKPRLDRWNLVPGESWQPALEEASSKCRSCAVFVGPNGMGRWQDEKMRAAITRRVNHRETSFRVIPVILPGVDEAQIKQLPASLAASTAVNFVDTIDDSAAFEQLVLGILGAQPAHSHAPNAKQETTVQWALVLTGRIDDIDKPIVEVIVEHLRKMTRDSNLTFKKIERGSIVLTLVGSRKAYEWISFLIRTGQLRQLEGFPIQTATLYEDQHSAEINAAESIQSNFLEFARRNRTRLTIYLMSGAKLPGTIKSFDTYSLVLNTDENEQLIFKHATSTVLSNRTPIIEVRTEDREAIRILRIVTRENGIDVTLKLSEHIDSLRELKIRKVVVNLEGVRGKSGVDRVIDLITALYDYLKATHGRLVLSIPPESLREVLKRDRVGRRLNVASSGKSVGDLAVSAAYG